MKNKFNFDFMFAEGSRHVNLLPIKVRLGFTLAEVLITLGIIGVVAAITIPALLTNLNNRHTESILREDYSILQQMMTSANDDGAISNFSVDKMNNMKYMREWFETYFLPYIKVANVCYDTKGCWIDDAKYPNGASVVGTVVTATGCGGTTISFQLYNGSSICMDDYKVALFDVYGIKSDEASLVFYLDTNGNKKPNVVGKDIFVFAYKPDIEKIVPAGFDRTAAEIERNCSKRGNGFWCVMLIKNRGWKIPRLK